MIRRVARSIRPAKSASMPVGWGRREPPIHRRQDKSADRGRAHVVGGIEVFGDLPRHRAGALPTKINDSNGPEAIARTDIEGRRP
jgi:hypothetical protein